MALSPRAATRLAAAGGIVAIESERGRGTTVLGTLPAPAGETEVVA